MRVDNRKVDEHSKKTHQEALFANTTLVTWTQLAAP
jgi:hypothetical protein